MPLHARVLQMASERKRSCLSQLRYVKRTEKEFLFGDRKPIFSGMHGLRFLSEASWEIVMFIFIYLFRVYFFFYEFLISFLIPKRFGY